MTKFNFKISKDIEDDCLKKNWNSIYNHSDINSFFSSYEWNHNLFKYVYCDKKSYFLEKKKPKDKQKHRELKQ